MSSTSIRPRLDNAHKWLEEQQVELDRPKEQRVGVVALALGPADLPARGQAPGSS
jgi:hypothetical protein